MVNDWLQMRPERQILPGKFCRLQLGRPCRAIDRHDCDNIDFIKISDSGMVSAMLMADRTAWGSRCGLGELNRGPRAMENAQLIRLSRQIALQRQMDVVANNLANINTTGFKAEKHAVRGIHDAGRQPTADFAFADQRPALHRRTGRPCTTWPAGAIVQTGNPLDVALNGDGFLAVQTPGGRALHQGRLACRSTPTARSSTSTAIRCWPTAARSSFDPTETDIIIAADGSIITSEGTKGKLRIVEFANPAGTDPRGQQPLCRRHAAAAADQHPRHAGLHREVQRLGRHRDDRDDPRPARLRDRSPPSCSSRTTCAAPPSSASAT